METLGVCEGLLYTGLTAGGWLGCCSTSLGVNELCYWGQTSGQQSATRAMPRTGRGRLPSTERVIPRITQQSVLMKSSQGRLKVLQLSFAWTMWSRVGVLILGKHPLSTLVALVLLGHWVSGFYYSHCEHIYYYSSSLIFYHNTAGQ